MDDRRPRSSSVAQKRLAPAGVYAMLLPPFKDAPNDNNGNGEFADGIPPPPPERGWKNDEEIFGYVLECIAAGMKMPAIRRALLFRGYTDEDTERILMDVSVWLRKTYPAVAEVARRQRLRHAVVCAALGLISLSVLIWTRATGNDDPKMYFLGCAGALTGGYYLFQTLANSKDY